MASFLGKLPFERLEERFRRCVARRRSRPGCRLRHAMGAQATPEGLGCVSDALADMEDEASIIRGILSSCSLLDGIDGDLPGDPVRHRPADRLAREGVYRGRQAKPALSGRHAGHVSDPEPVPLARGEDAFDEVQARAARLRLLCGPVPPGRSLAAIPGFRMICGTRFPLATMPPRRNSRSMRRQPQRPLCLRNASTTSPSSASRSIRASGFFRPGCS